VRYELIKVYQEVLDPEDGDCFSACVASVLEIRLDEVPLFQTPTHPGFMPWLAERGLTAMMFDAAQSDKPAAEWLVPYGFSIAVGKSPSGLHGHAVVAFDGEYFHDPSPKAKGLFLDGPPYFFLGIALSQVGAVIPLIESGRVK
jgi:hypothetical protein